MKVREYALSCVMKAREWAASILISPGAAILALSFVLPAVQGCGDSAYYPYEFPMFYFPYVFGALCIFAGVYLARNQITKRLALFFHLLTGAGGVAWGVWLHANILKETDSGRSNPEDALSALFMIFTWWLGALFLALGMRLHNNEKKTARTIWAGSIWCIAFFTIFIVDKPLYGLKLSFAGSIALLFGGLIAEFFPRDQENR